MWTHISLNVHVVWDDALWSVTALYQDDQESEPIALSKSGRASLEGVEDPDGILAVAVRALERVALEGR